VHAVDPPPPLAPRLLTLDFLRGVAVLGILLMNIVGFAWPAAAVLSPRAPVGPHGPGDEALFLIQFVLVDGKLRGLFSLLFGASMLLFIERAYAAGEDGWHLQTRRLGWLALFGLMHYYLLWWGDILFLYAACGFLALGATEWPTRRLVGVALALFAGGVIWLGALTVDDAAPWLGAGAPGGAGELERRMAVQARLETELHLGPWLDKVGHQLSHEWAWPLTTLSTSVFETLPLILLGMAALRSGLLSGAWPARRTGVLAAAGILVGLAATLPLAVWLARAGFPLGLAILVNLALAAPGRLAMTLGYAAALVLLARRFAATRAGSRIVAAGRMAFSNYLGTSLLMAALFQGWGLGLYGRYSRVELLAFVALGWVLMLAWSKPWLGRYRQGPLEWVWRSLSRRRIEPIRRVANAKDSH
jgi:uncharacterized protein